MKRITIFSFLIVFACSFWGELNFSAHAGESVILTDDQDKYQLGLQLEYLEDPAGELTFDEILSNSFVKQFIPSEGEIPITPRIALDAA